MSTTSSFYPNLGTIITLNNFPEELQFIKDGLQSALNKIYFKDLQFVKSKDGSQGFYSITLVTGDNLKLDIFGTGFALIFNPDVAGESTIPLTLNYNWPIIGIINNFNLEDFSFLPEDLQSILNSTQTLGDNDLLQTSIQSFEGSTTFTSVQSLVDKINTYYSLTGSNIIPYPSTADILSMSDEIISSIESNLLINDSLNNVVNNLYLNSGLSNFSDNLNKFSSAINQESIESYVKRIIIPKIDASLELGVGLSFPRNVLLPLDAPGGNPLPDTFNSILIFNAGTLKFSTQGGIGFDEEMDIHLNHPSQIGKTGLGIVLEKAKIDLSRTKNISEADLDGRPSDFIGVYIKKLAIILPAKWFKEDTAMPTTVQIAGYNMLMGTGGISGTVALEAVGGDNILWKKIGSSDGFSIGFEYFNITFKQNKVTSSNIKAKLEIKKFVYPGTNSPVKIDVIGHLSDDGDFNLTASAQPPYPITFPDVFTYSLKSVELGKEEDDFYIGTSGTLQFEGFLRETLKLGPIEIERLRIYSDGSIEFQGGSVQLIEPIVLPLGPVEITVSAIHYGSHQKEVDGVTRKFNYFGFDGGVKIDPLGIEVRGDGVKYYYCVDDHPDHPKPKPYLHIQTLYLDLTIPADSGSVATINGWVTIPEPGISKEYAGGVTLQIPKANLAGKADIKLMPKYPAFLIDCEIEPSVPIPLGSFAIFGFRGLLGYRYVAEKEAIPGLTADNTWYEYYKAPKLGINVHKFNGPNQSVNYDTLVSLGAGATLGTAADDGYTFSIKAMALFCIPSLFILDGRANLLAKRLGLDETVDPPFFAFVAVGDNSLEFGFGANYKLPTSGNILTVNGEIQAGFFFKNQKPWYVNVGTNINPITARVLTLLTIKSYVMLSARGIEAGARGEFNFNRNYGVIKVQAHAFIEIGGRVSFKRPQIGAYLMAGVTARIKVLFVNLTLEIGILFGVEAPRPFKIYGKFYFKIKVGIKIFGKRITLFKFKGNLEVVWNFNKNIDLSPINPMIGQSSSTNDNFTELVQGINMLSNEVFLLGYLNSKPTLPPDDTILNHVIPLDTYIDIKTEKGLLPGNAQEPNNSVRRLIGGINNGPSDYEDLIPPVSSIRGKEIRQVKHQYTIDHLEIKFWNTTKNIWEDYHPYEALYPSDPNISQKKIGQFQKTDGKYNAVRILATTPFSYTEQGQPGWYVPEQYGIDATTLFCEADAREHKCAKFLLKPLNAKYYCGDPNALVYSNNVAFELITPNIEEDYAFISDEPNSYDVPKSLAFNNWNSMQILLPEPSKMTELKLTNYTNGVKVRFYAVIQNSLTNPSDSVEYGNPDPSSPNVNEPYELVLFADALQEPIQYNFTINPDNSEWEVIHADWNPVSKIVIEPIFDSSISQQIAILNDQIATIENDNNLISLGLIEGEILSTASLEDDLHQLICGANATSGGSPTSFINRFFKKNKLNYYYSKEFTERESRFVYALGTSENDGLISKIKTDGSLVWERKYDLPEGKEKLVFKRIIQLTDDLEQENRFQYVVYATNGNQNYLMSFNPEDGKVIWTKLIDWKDEDSFVHIAPCKNEFNFYLTLSDRNQIDTYKEPLVAVIDAAGEFVSGTLLAIEKEEFIINAVCEDDNGIVLAGRYIEGNYDDSVGTIIRLDRNLKIVHSLKIDNQYTTIHSIKITDNGKYLVSGYDNKIDGIFAILIDSEGEFIQHHFPATKNRNSSIQLCEGGFYLLQNNDDNGRIYRLSMDFDVLWTKEIHLSSGTNGIRNFTFNRETKKLAFNCFNQSEGSLVVYTDENLNSCLSNTLDKPTLISVRVMVKKLAVKEERYVLKLYPLDLESKTIDSEIKRYCQDTGCGEEDVKVCELYQEILNIYENCLIVPSLISNQNFDAVSLCYRDILNLIKNFDANYNLSEHLAVQIQFINDFLGKKDIHNYTIAWDGIQSILDYLNEIGNCICNCTSNEFTLIHQVCWMSVQDYDYNINIPSQDAVEEDALATVAGITQYIQPIWRPDTSYYIHFVLKDRVSIGNQVNVTPFEFTYGFSTAGPVGFFHNNEKSTYGDIKLKSGDQLLKEDNSYFRVEGNNLMDQNNTVYVSSPDGFVLEDTTGLLRGNEVGSYIIEPGSDPQRRLRVVAHPDKYSLTSLKPYIDYNRSYPNADGNLLSAKPLFYNDYNEVDGGTTKISLFFNKAYATHFFHKWESYKIEQNIPDPNPTLPSDNAIDGRLKIVIKDPVEDISIVNPPYLDYNPTDNVYTHIPQTQEVWSPETNPQVPFAVSQYLNLFNAPNCVGQVTIIKPASEYVTIFPKRLKPNKLYTAIVNNLFDVNHSGDFENNAGVEETKEVHKFIFKTSRYKDFEAQIKSYFLKREFEEGLIEKEAIFRFEKQFSDDEVNASFVTTKNWSQPNTSQLPITGFASGVIDTLMNDYQHPYDRIFDGILDLKPLDEAISTEVNIIKNSSSGNIIALIVRNPEPFNNPKFNKEVMKDTIEVITNGNIDLSYFVLFSKDNSQAIIMNSEKNITQNVTLRFKYKVYQDALPGDDVVINYPVKSVQELNLDLLNN